MGSRDEGELLTLVGSSEEAGVEDGAEATKEKKVQSSTYSSGLPQNFGLGLPMSEML